MTLGWGKSQWGKGRSAQNKRKQKKTKTLSAHDERVGMRKKARLENALTRRPLVSEAVLRQREGEKRHLRCKTEKY